MPLQPPKPNTPAETQANKILTHRIESDDDYKYLASLVDNDSEESSENPQAEE